MIKTFDIILREDKFSISLAAKIEERLIQASFIIDKINPDLVITIGGDGTLLKAVHHYLKNSDRVMFCGIHTGTLGFYTDYLASEVDDLLDKIIAQDFSVIKYNLVESKIYYNKQVKTIHALNEIRVENAKQTLILDIFINNKYFESFRGNGLCFSSPTGSTGYAKSLGGAILHPKTKTMQMIEVASINNISYRSLGSPIVLASQHQVKLNFKDTKGAIIGFDSFAQDLDIDYPNLEYMTFQLSEKSVNMARFRTFHFLDRVKKHFILDDSE